MAASSLLHAEIWAFHSFVLSQVVSKAISVACNRIRFCIIVGTHIPLIQVCLGLHFYIILSWIFWVLGLDCQFSSIFNFDLMPTWSHILPDGIHTSRYQMAAWRSCNRKAAQLAPNFLIWSYWQLLTRQRTMESCHATHFVLLCKTFISKRVKSESFNWRWQVQIESYARW